MKAGVARVEITPPVGHIIHSGDKVSEGIGDPLHAKALVFDDGERRAALLSADLILLEEDVISDVRHRIAERTSIPAANVMFAASHTHCGPPTARWLSPRVSAEYLAALREKLSTVVVEAWKAQRPACLGTGMGEAKVTVNRWVETPEGARWGVNWDGPTDPSVNVLRVDDAEGKSFAAMVNFASHATVVNFGTNRRYTGDYPSHLQAALERAYPEVTALFTNGAAGDLKIAFANEEGTGFAYGGLEDARRYGAMIGEEAARVMAVTATRPVGYIAMASRWVDLRLQSAPTEEELRRELEQPEYEFWSEGWANEMLEALRRGPLPTCVRAEVQALRLGDVATLIALPGEAFVEIGLHLKRLFVRQPSPFVVAYANGYCGYLPSARSVQYDGTRPRYNWHKIVGYPALYAEEVEEVLVTAARQAAGSAKPETEMARTTSGAGAASEAPAPEASPVYTDKMNLLAYIGADGEEQPITRAADWPKRRTHILVSMQLVMGPLPPPSRKVPLDVQVLEAVKFPKFTRKKITYAAEAGDRVPAYLLIPNALKGKAPAMLCLHPTHPLGKGDSVGLSDRANRNYGGELAERGYVVLAPDYPGTGWDHWFGDYQVEVYALGYASATMKGIWNHVRAVDLLQSLPEVDGERLGAIGHSLGGYNAIFAAVFDPRLRVIVSSAGFNSFCKYKGGDLTGWSRAVHMPLIATAYGNDPKRMPFDFTEVIAALAPRPFFINAPLGDDNFEVSGVQDCVAAAAPVYDLLGAKDNLVARYPECGHDFPPEVRYAAYAFVDGALRR